MRADQDRRDTALRQVHQQLVQLDREEPFLGHRVQIAVEAVDDDELCPLLDREAYGVHELAGRELRRVHLL